ncbi:hypothetical protein TI03_04580, partial [Achromatium sp. WMS1]
MVAFQRLLYQEQIPQRLLQRPDGQRWLTNLLQLAELLQINARNHSGPEELLRWFMAQQAVDIVTDETEQIRLESDENLVKIVTMHKSKGLEYPVVFIPFPWSYKSLSTKQPIVFHDLKTFQLVFDVGTENQEAHRKLQSTENLAEQMRLLYVAVTRAAHLCVIFWGKINKAKDSALALLLHPDPESPTTSRLDKLSTADIRADLQALANKALLNSSACIAVQDIPLPSEIRWHGFITEPIHLQAAAFNGVIDTNWSISSYSGLVRKEEPGRPDHDRPIREKQDLAEPVDLITNIDPILNFPAGATVGQFLHSILEQLDFPKAHGETLHNVVYESLAHYGSLSPNPPPIEGDDWGVITEMLITNCLDTPLEPVTAQVTKRLCLRDISWNNRISELEFYYPIANLSLKALRATLAP